MKTGPTPIMLLFTTAQSGDTHLIHFRCTKYFVFLQETEFRVELSSICRRSRASIKVSCVTALNMHFTLEIKEKVLFDKGLPLVSGDSVPRLSERTRTREKFDSWHSQDKWEGIQSYYMESFSRISNLLFHHESPVGVSETAIKAISLTWTMMVFMDSL